MTEFTMYFGQNYGDVMIQRKSILRALSEGPVSVSQIAEKAGVSKQVTMWNLLALLRWGDVEIAGEEHHELVFALREV
ncbi:MAG: winged helix-turn-helix transcriptional regulator [Candidatus Thorarchaeota archaeon]|nr:MAG: winged helix-turn-helix transcriptional regulator [Candidatus Thorarchaeota archaeon]